MELWRAVDILNRRKWLLVLSVMVAAVLTYAMARASGARWQATVRFVSPAPPSITNAPNDQPSNPDWVTEGQDFKALEATYAAMITSREVIEPALKELGLRLDPADLLEQIEFDATGPRTFELHVYDGDPARAGQLANALAEAFVERNHRLYTQRSARAVALLEDQLRTADKRLSESRRRYETYQARYRLLRSPVEERKATLEQVEAARRRRDLTNQEVAAVRARLAGTRREIALLRPSLSRGGVSAAAAASAATSGKMLALLEEELARSDTELTRLRGIYPPTAYEVEVAVAANRELRGRLAQARAEEARTGVERTRAAGFAELVATENSLRQRVIGLEAERAEVSASIAAAESQLERSQELEARYNALTAEFDARTAARDALSNRLNGAQRALDFAERQNPVTIMQRADALNPPVNLSAGRTRKLVVLAALFALLSTSGVLVALVSIDRRVQSLREAEMALPVGVLAAIPQPTDAALVPSLARVTELHPQSIQAEAYRFLSLQLLAEREPRVQSLMALSAKADQGATTTMANLGITLAQAGFRVILVDANTRAPGLHHVFGLSNEVGFSDLLLRPTNGVLKQAVQDTSTPNLRVIPSGSTPDNPWELFRSDNLQQLSKQLRDIADFVLYDTPSALLFTDALNLASVVDAAVLCVRAQEPLSGAEQRLVALVQQAGVLVLGSVLCDVPPDGFEGFDNYRHSYEPAQRARARAAIRGRYAAALPAAAAGGGAPRRPTAVVAPPPAAVATTEPARGDGAA